MHSGDAFGEDNLGSHAPRSGNGWRPSLQINQGPGNGRDLGGRELRIYIPVSSVTCDFDEHFASLNLFRHLCSGKRAVVKIK